MIRKIDNLDEAFSIALKMPWAYIASYSTLTLGFTPEQVDWDELLDARFFGPEGELRLFRQEDSLSAAWVDDTPQAGELEATIDKTAALRPGFGRTIRMRQHIFFDDDGQACIYTTRLSAWKGDEEHDPDRTTAAPSGANPGAL